MSYSDRRQPTDADPTHAAPRRRFEHVDELAAIGLSEPDARTMHFLWQIVDEGVLGASRHVSLGIEMVRHILESAPASEAWARARHVIDFVARTRGRDTPVIGNSLAALLAGLDAVPATGRAAALADRARTWNEDAAARKERLVSAAARHLGETRGILAFDYSSTVAAIVLRLVARGARPLVFVPESRSIDGGEKYLAEFLAAGLPVRFIPDAAIEYGLVRCDAVLLGVETLRADGSFLNTIGSAMIARLAVPRGIDVYGCSDLMKLDQGSYEGRRPDPALRRYDRIIPSSLGKEARELVDTSAPELEVIPASLVTALLTEYGPVPPAAIWALGRPTIAEGGGQ